VDLAMFAHGSPYPFPSLLLRPLSPVDPTTEGTDRHLIPDTPASALALEAVPGCSNPDGRCSIRRNAAARLRSADAASRRPIPQPQGWPTLRSTAQPPRA